MKLLGLLRFLSLAPLGVLGATAPPADDLNACVAAIQAVGPEGQGNALATPAWRLLAALPADRLPEVLAALDGANELAANWVQAAVDTIVQRARREGAPLPLLGLGNFLLNPAHDPRARSLAYELLSQINPDTAQSMLPGLLNDPSVDLRRAAVGHLIDQAQLQVDQGATNSAILLHRQALGFARDVDQIQQISARLKKWSQSVDLPRHFGFLMQWQVIGPFDNTTNAGFHTVFPPEADPGSPPDLTASHPGKTGPVRWQSVVSTHDYGRIDINPVCGTLKEVTAYAYTVFQSDTARPAELRLGCKNGWKIWCNGSFLFGRDEYHRGQQIDQYRLPVSLQRGPNLILLKICQNEMIEDWTREWEFQLRVCDATGTAILSTDRPASSHSP